MICSHCNKEISDNAAFCTECGQRVVPVKAPEPAVSPAPVEKPAFTPAAFPETAPAAPAVPETPAVAATPAAPRAPLAPASDVLTPSTPAAPLSPAPLSPAPAANPVAAPAFVPAAFPAQPILPNPERYEESTYYHLNATEVFDFEAMRGIAIVLIILSVMSVVGIVLTMPLAIISLIVACQGLGERNTASLKSKFNTCKILSIICILILLALVIAFFGLVIAGGSLAEFMEKTSEFI